MKRFKGCDILNSYTEETGKLIMSCDLHTHSLFSDGTFSPEEIIAQAKKIGLEAVALTDHNTVSGLPDFIQAAAMNGINAVGGIELSTVHGKTELHLLGLFIMPEYYDKVERLVKEFRVLKEINNIETVERLNEAGYAIKYSEIRKKNPEGNMNRAHIAAALMEKGYASSITQAFEEILHEGGGFYVPPERLNLIDAIRFLRSINAVPVIAHALKDADEAALRQVLPQAIEAGLMGLETRHSDYSKEDAVTAERIAADFNLLRSGGSDFHGATKPDINLGSGKGSLDVPNEFYHALSSSC